MDDPHTRFAGLYDQYYRNVLRYALQQAEPGSAEDVASETFLIAWRRLSDVPEPPLPWLLGVARNLLRKQAAAGHRRRQLAGRLAALSSPGDLAAWDTGEHVVERAAALSALASLPDRDIETLTLVTWHGLDTEAAAAVVGCTPRAFTVRLHRARQRLAESLLSLQQDAARRGQPPRRHGSAQREPRTRREQPARQHEQPAPQEQPARQYEQPASQEQPGQHPAASALRAHVARQTAPMPEPMPEWSKR